ncbi:MAG: redoxin domain-containing protein [Deferribacteres bacterium]|nr:redoxin domain-containing protein [candidate division KSB1 bacterium]MCB9500707.1 redoxin domain-containing protein [Deferribacteres bacterium]
MAQLRHNYPEYSQKDTEIIVLGPDDAEDFKRNWERENLPFIGLPDPKYTVLDLYGQEVKLFKFGRLPAQLLVDKMGIVRFVHYGNSMSDITSNRDILQVIEEEL